MTPLDKTLKRSLAINGVDYVLTLSPDSLKLTRKGKRLGMELRWADIASGDSALAIALQASVGRLDPDKNEKRASQAAPKKVSVKSPARRQVRRVSAGRPRRAK
jgi:hypothetical protein